MHSGPASQIDVERPISDGVSSAYAQLAHEIERALRGDASLPAGQRVLRVAVPLAIDPLTWLARQTPAPSFYWSNRDGAETYAGIGIADQFILESHNDLTSLVERILTLTNHSQDLRYWGGLSFAAGAPLTDAWKDFAAGWFFLPRFAVQSRQGRETQLVCHLLLPDDRARKSEILGALAQIEQRQTNPSPTQSGAILERRDRPTAAAWNNSVADVLAQIARGEVTKVVLAREIELTLSHVVDPLTVLGLLKSTHPHCFCFAFRPQARAPMFVGASPERLYQREGDRVLSEAIAGTRPRARTMTDDRSFANELLHSPKELHEHDLVVAAIREGLRALSNSVEVDAAPAVLQLKDMQHLVTRHCARLRENVGDAELLETLHPTPAVGGTPRTIALSAIHEHEPFDRGWYSGPVGYIGREQSELAVAIRSALIDQRTVRIFAGAGIVAGSTPAAEWAEIEAKATAFIHALETRLELSER